MMATGEHMAGGRAARLEPLLVAMAHFAAAAISLGLTRWSNGLATVWLPNAILLAYLLLAPRNRWPLAVALVWVSGTIANSIGGAPSWLAVVFGATNMVEPLAIAFVLGAGLRTVDLERIGDLLRFVSIATIGTAITATIASVAAHPFDVDFRDVWSSWFLSSFLGLAIITPIVLIGIKEIRNPRLTGMQLLELLGMLMLVALAGLTVFSSESKILFFFLQPPILVATFRLRALGAAASVLMLAVIGTAVIMMRFAAPGADGVAVSAELTILQAFLCVSVLTALPVAALLEERDRYSRSLAKREEELGAIVEAVSDVIFRTDADGRWTYLNPAWEHLSGYAVEEAIGRSVLSHVVAEDRDELIDSFQDLMFGPIETIRHQFRFRTAAGDFRWGEVQSRRLRGPDGEVIGSAGIIVDISDRLALAAMAEDARLRAEREAEAALLLAATDELTGVASRRAFLATLDQHLSRGEQLAIALFDIDFFKLVNDRYGHAVGDEVLRRVAGIAQRCVRDQDLVGRIGGEEFAILMPGASPEQAAAAGERLRSACAETVHPPGLTATISLGVAAASNDATSATLLRDADAALYRAKFEGRNCLRVAA